MKIRLSYLFTLALAIGLTSSVFGQSNKDNAIQASDLATLVGNWEGSLTYLNYGDNQYVTIETNLEIVAGENENELAVTNTYPDEPNAGGSYRLRITKKGMRLNKEPVISRSLLDDGTIEVVTQYRGRDDNKRAQIRITYRISDSSYTSRKDVQYKGETEWIKRNEFSYQRS